jgi:eukaryotic translation initiation factor 2C
VGDLPTRPGFGKDGRPITLRANYFPIKISKKEIYEFDMAADPPFTNKTPRRLRKQIFECMDRSREFAPYVEHVAHDFSAMAYSAKPILNNDPLTPLVVKFNFVDEEGVQVKDKKSNPVVYKVTFTFIKALNTTDLVT